MNKKSNYSYFFKIASFIFEYPVFNLAPNWLTTTDAAYEPNLPAVSGEPELINP